MSSIDIGMTHHAIGIGINHHGIGIGMSSSIGMVPILIQIPGLLFVNIPGIGMGIGMGMGMDV